MPIERNRNGKWWPRFPKKCSGDCATGRVAIAVWSIDPVAGVSTCTGELAPDKMAALRRTIKKRCMFGIVNLVWWRKAPGAAVEVSTALGLILSVRQR